MPELPELEAIRSVLNTSVQGARLASVSLPQPIVVRFPTAREFGPAIEGKTVGLTTRRGKFLLVSLDPGLTLAINPMLTGRLFLAEPKAKKTGRLALVLSLDDGRELRYVDAKVMGKLYLVPADRLYLIHRWDEMGPEALDPALDLPAFRDRIKKRQGQIKNILTDDEFVAGIGNAWSDEILWAAGLHPYRKRSSLKPVDVDRLYAAMHEVLEEGMRLVAGRIDEHMLEGLAEGKIRDFMRVHGKGGLPCPRCGSTISEITANQRLVNFCRRCQPDL